MSERHGRPARRLRAVRPPVQRLTAAESAASILPGNPRVGALDALLREVDGLRLTLETDLTLAASAVESGATGLAVEILESDRVGLAQFEDRALGHLSGLAAEPVLAIRRRRRVPALPFVAAAALVGFLMGVLPTTAGSSPDSVATSALAANSSLEQLKGFAANGTTSQVRAAAATLHQQLLAVVAQAATNPAAAQQALLLLSYERDAIVQSGDSFALHDVLVQSAALANKIRNALPATVRLSVPRVPAVAPASPAPKPAPTKAKASPTPSATPKPKAKPSPTPQPSPSQGPVLPTGNPVNP